MSAGRRHPPLLSGCLVYWGERGWGWEAGVVWVRAGVGSNGSQSLPALGFSSTISAAFLGVCGLRGPVLTIAQHPRGHFWERLGRERFQSCARLHLLKIAKLGLEGILKGVSKINTIILIINICVGRTTVDLCGETQSLHCLLPHVCGARWAAANPSTWRMILFFFACS